MSDLTELLEMVEAIPDPAGDLDHLVDSWDMLDAIAKTLAAQVRAYNVAAADLLADLEYDPKQGFQSHGGVIVHHRQSASDSWDGAAVLSALAVQQVEPSTGELVEAVPVEVLADVIPAIRGKSSRWLATGLKVHGIDPDRYRERKWNHPTISKGTKR